MDYVLKHWFLYAPHDLLLSFRTHFRWIIEVFPSRRSRARPIISQQSIERPAPQSWVGGVSAGQTAHNYGLATTNSYTISWFTRSNSPRHWPQRTNIRTIPHWRRKKWHTLSLLLTNLLITRTLKLGSTSRSRMRFWQNRLRCMWVNDFIRVLAMVELTCAVPNAL